MIKRPAACRKLPGWLRPVSRWSGIRPPGRAFETIREKIPKSGEVLPQKFQGLEVLKIKSPNLGSFWGKKFQTLEVLGQKVSNLGSFPAKVPSFGSFGRKSSKHWKFGVSSYRACPGACGDVSRLLLLYGGARAVTTIRNLSPRREGGQMKRMQTGDSFPS